MNVRLDPSLLNDPVSQLSITVGRKLTRAPGSISRPPAFTFSLPPSLPPSSPARAPIPLCRSALLSPISSKSRPQITSRLVRLEAVIPGRVRRKSARAVAGVGARSERECEGARVKSRHQDAKFEFTFWEREMVKRRSCSILTRLGLGSEE